MEKPKKSAVNHITLAQRKALLREVQRAIEQIRVQASPGMCPSCLARTLAGALLAPLAECLAAGVNRGEDVLKFFDLLFEQTEVAFQQREATELAAEAGLAAPTVHLWRCASGCLAVVT